MNGTDSRILILHAVGLSSVYPLLSCSDIHSGALNEDGARYALSLFSNKYKNRDRRVRLPRHFYKTLGDQYNGHLVSDSFLSYENPIMAAVTIGWRIVRHSKYDTENIELLFYGAIWRGLLVAYREKRRIEWKDIPWSLLHEELHALPLSCEVPLGLNELEGLTLNRDSERFIHLKEESEKYMKRVDEKRKRNRELKAHRIRVENCHHCGCRRDSGRRCCHCGDGFD